MSISAHQVKELRERTGAGMMDCKKALTETDGDMDAAIDWLRKKGLSKAAKKADRVAAEGLIGIASETGRAALVEVNSETDFVARNAQFQNLVQTIAQQALVGAGDRDGVLAAPYPGKQTSISDEITETIATIGENMTLRRTAFLEASPGVVATYVHNQIAEGLGKIGVLVALEVDSTADIVHDLGRRIAMHVAAVAPLAVRPEELDPEILEKERAIFADQARATGKSEAIVEKMIEGRVRKFYEEQVLLKQTFVVDPDHTVEQAVESVAETVGVPIHVAAFVRFELGEGVEKDEADFAAEVAAAAGQ